MNYPQRSIPAGYELRIQGHLDQHWSAWFGGLTVTHNDDGTTTLRGVVTDQPELHGLLAKVRDLGITLLSVTPLDTVNPSRGVSLATGPSIAVPGVVEDNALDPGQASVCSRSRVRCPDLRRPCG